LNAAYPNTIGKGYLPDCAMPGWLFNVDELSTHRIAQQFKRSEEND
jgi:hypothetical protein